MQRRGGDDTRAVSDLEARVDICLDKQSRYQAAAEVMKSVSDAGFAVGNFHCGTPPATS